MFYKYKWLTGNSYWKRNVVESIPLNHIQKDNTYILYALSKDVPNQPFYFMN